MRCFGKLNMTFEVISTKSLDEPKKFTTPQIERQVEGTLILTINDIKVDVISYPYEQIAPSINEEGIRLLSKKDIAPMKLSAIAGRGSKKDFFDLAVLLEDYSLKEMLDFFAMKFPEVNPFQVLKSLLYFDDAEEDGDPIMLIDLTWEEVKHKIELAVSQFLKS